MHEIQEEVKARARAGPCPVSLIQQKSFIQTDKTFDTMCWGWWDQNKKYFVRLRRMGRQR